MFTNDVMPSVNYSFDDKRKAIQIVTHWQDHSRSVSSITPNLHGVRQGSLDDLVSRFVNASRVLIIQLWLKSLHARTVVKVWETHADGNRKCQGSQSSWISGLSRHRIQMIERSLNRVTVLSGMTRNCSTNLVTQISQLSDWSNVRVAELGIAAQRLGVSLAVGSCLHCADQTAHALASSLALLPMHLVAAPHSDPNQFPHLVCFLVRRQKQVE